MEEFKGTQGKWEYHSGENIGVASKNPLRIIADVELDKDIPTEEQLANAKLIAAAPEMLEALKDFVKAIENEDITIYDNLDHDGFASTPGRIYQKSKKVIEKALGKNF